MELRIEKLVFGGQGLAHAADKPVFVWNALPGELVEARVTKRRSSHWEAVAEQIAEASPHRQLPVEPHFLSSSPWGIMDFAYENELKREIAEETYRRIGQLQVEPEIAADDQHQYGYRNKIEYSFYEFDAADENTGENAYENAKHGMALAFFERNSHHKVPITESALADSRITRCAQELLTWVNQQSFTRRDIKTIIVRSTRQGQTLAGVFLKNEAMRPATGKIAGGLTLHYPSLSEAMNGIQVYYSTYKSPASVPTALLYQAGIDHLTETISSVELDYGLFSFFQVNCPLFEMALRDISQWILSNRPLVDLYSGVGAIGLPLAKQRQVPVTLVESNSEAAAFAASNIEKNQLARCSVRCVPSEDALDAIQSESVVIVDPPRAGLHEKVVRRIFEVKPAQILYLSCHLSTQARDVAALAEHYAVTRSRLYNFFPRTPHIEGLIGLERKP